MNEETKAYLNFDKMIAPLILKFLFWIFAIVAVLGGLAGIFNGEIIAGLSFIIFGPIIVRIYVEIIMVMFSINTAVQKIASKDG